MAMRAKHSGAVILGGGVVKHHIMNANLMRNGTDHCVYINTGQEVLSAVVACVVVVGLICMACRMRLRVVRCILLREDY
jgi:hypothetical protein